jgi:hypothetical protein
MPDIDLSKYYTPEEAAKVMSKNSKRSVSATYVRQLAHYGKIPRVKINNRLSVYPREDIENYIVKDPGVRSGEAAKKRAEKRQKGQ